MSSQVSICSPRGFAYRAILRCRKCKRRTRHLIRTYVWYDPTIKCLAHEVRVPYSYRLSPKRADAMWRGAMTRAEANAAVGAACWRDVVAERDALRAAISGAIDIADRLRTALGGEVGK